MNLFRTHITLSTLIFCTTLCGWAQSYMYVQLNVGDVDSITHSSEKIDNSYYDLTDSIIYPPHVSAMIGTMVQAQAGVPNSILCSDENIEALFSGNANYQREGITWTHTGMFTLIDDAGTAIALEYDTNAEDIVVEFHTMGSGYKALMTPHGGFRNPTTPDSFEYKDFGNGIIRRKRDTLIEGMDVFTFAISRPPKSFEQFIADYQVDREADIDFYLIHQANKMIVDRLVKKLKLPVEKVPYNLEQFGNTGGASVPMLMVTRLREQLQRDQSHRLLCSSFGLGLSWGTMLLNVNNLVIPELIEI